MIEFTTPIPDYPSDIDKTVTEEQLEKLFIDNIQRLTSKEKDRQIWQNDTSDILYGLRTLPDD